MATTLTTPTTVCFLERPHPHPWRWIWMAFNTLSDLSSPPTFWTVHISLSKIRHFIRSLFNVVCLFSTVQVVVLQSCFVGHPLPLKSYISKIMCVLFSLHIYFPVFRIHNLFFGYSFCFRIQFLFSGYTFYFPDIYFMFSGYVFCFPDTFYAFWIYFLFSGYILCIPNIFCVFWIYFMISGYIFCFPEIFSVFRIYFLFSGNIFCFPDIFSVFRIYFLFSGYIFGYIPRFPVNNKPRKCEDQTNLCQRWSKNGACALDKSFVTR